MDTEELPLLKKEEKEGGIRKYVTITWKCSTMCSTITMLLLSLGIFIVGAIMWKTIDGHFEIATSYDDVICFSCVIGLTISTIILVIGSTLTLLLLCCCFVAKLHKFNLGLLITVFYTIAAIIAIVIVITTPIWLSEQSDIVQRFEESSKSSFRMQVIDPSIREIWDEYQYHFGCCGVQDYKDYYKYFGRNYSIPISCCNYTTLGDTSAASIDCSVIVQKVTDEDISSYYIYGTGCPYVIVDKLKLNSTIIHDVGIGITTCSAFIFVSVFTIFVFTMIAIPEDTNQLLCLIAAIFCTLFAIMKACFGGSHDVN